MNLVKIVLSAIEELNKNNLPKGKTAIQKIVYLSLSKKEQKNLYKPYHYGPYSEMIQNIIRSLLSLEILVYRNNKLKIKNKEEMIFANTSKEVVNTIKFLKENKILTLRQIANFSKIHYLYFHGKKKTPSEIKNFSKFIGWKNISHLSDNFIKNYIELAEKINN